ncbi:hypothetical protein GGC47_005308 [Bosea sp. OAE752]
MTPAAERKAVAHLAEHHCEPMPFRWKANPDEIIAAAARGHQAFDTIH